MFRFLLSFIIAAFLLSTSSSSFAAAASEKDQKFGSWVMKCAPVGKGESCLITQAFMIRDTAKSKDSGIGLVGIAIGYSKKEAKPQIAIQIPGKAIKKEGLTFQIDSGKTYAVVLDSCNTQKCLAKGFLADTVRDQMLKGTSMTVTYKVQDETAGQEKRLRIKVPLEGFDDAWAALNKSHK